MADDGVELVNATPRARTGRGHWRAVLPVSIAALVLAVPRPGPLTPEAWHYFALFVAVIAGLITDVLPGSVAGLIGITLATLLGLVATDPADSIRWALTGFADTTVWLMFVAFMFALGYAKTGLGRRIALRLVRRLGGRTLGLGYAIALADLALAPFVPSNTARSGGIIFPIVENIPALYGSASGETRRGIGTYVMWTAFATTCVTSSMFLTALAPNLLAVSLLKRIAHVDVSWIRWLTGFLPVGVLLFLVQPLLIHRLCSPRLTATEEIPQWADRELARMGTMSRRELGMAALAGLALVLWIFAPRWMSATTVALLCLCGMMLTGVVSWDDVLGYRRGWNNLVWFATLITLADGLTRVGFLPWFAGAVARHLDGLPGFAKVMLLVVVFFLSHYMFASVTAHVTAMIPVLMAVGSTIPDMNMEKLALLLCLQLGIMGIITPYASGPSPVYYGSGYLPSADYWRLGAIFGVIFFAAFLVIGVPWMLFIR